LYRVTHDESGRANRVLRDLAARGRALARS
jgi:hypothetical protein